MSDDVGWVDGYIYLDIAGCTGSACSSERRNLSVTRFGVRGDLKREGRGGARGQSP